MQKKKNGKKFLQWMHQAITLPDKMFPSKKQKKGKVSAVKHVKFFFYRKYIFCKAFCALWVLPKEKLDAFLDSYDVFTHDWRDEEKLKRELGDDYYGKAKRKIEDWYYVINLLCTLGSVEKMYIPPQIDPSKNIFDNQDLYEKKMVDDLHIKKRDKVLDIGCGRGRVAYHVAQLSGAHVTGFNLDESQIKEAQNFSEMMGYGDHTHFFVRDMNKLPYAFADNSMDAVYHVQALSYATDLTAIMKEAFRVLKPGGRFCSLDLVYQDNYDPNNKQHVEQVNKIKPLVGAVGIRTTKEYTQAYKDAGFKIAISNLPSVIDIDGPTMEKASKEYARMHKVVNSLVKWKLMPAHFKVLFDQIDRFTDVYLKINKEKLISMNYQVVGIKPGQDDIGVSVLDCYQCVSGRDDIGAGCNGCRECLGEGRTPDDCNANCHECLVDCRASEACNEDCGYECRSVR